MAEKEYIEREAVEKVIDGFAGYLLDDDTIFRIKYALRKHIPSADVAPVRYGQWVDCNEEAAGCCSEAVHCSLCGEEAPISASDYYCRGGKIRYEIAPFCPNCGAKMDGGDNE